MKYLTTGLEVHHHGKLLVGVRSGRGPDVDEKTVFVVLAAKALLHARTNFAILQHVSTNEFLWISELAWKRLHLRHSECLQWIQGPQEHAIASRQWEL